MTRSEMDARASLAAIQRHFHRLILATAGGLVEQHRLALPKLNQLRASKEKPAWFPIPGMYGGFAYWLEGTGAEVRLVTEISWPFMVMTKLPVHVPVRS